MFTRLFLLSFIGLAASQTTSSTVSCFDCTTWTVSINGATAGTSDTGIGFGSMTLIGNQLTVTGMSFAGASNPITAANIRFVGTGNGNGAVVFALPDFPTGSAGSYSTHTFTLTTNQLAELKCQRLFVCLGSANHPLGDLRGQIVSSCSTTGVQTTSVQTTSIQTTGFSTCNNVTNTCRAEEARPGGHAIAVPGIARDFVFANNSGFYTESTQGDFARLGGQVYSRSVPSLQFDLEVTFYTFVSANNPPSGSPKEELEPPLYVQHGGPINSSTFHYYAYWNGTMTGLGQYVGAVIQLRQYMASWQVGVGGNGVNVNYGGSGWYEYEVISQPTDRSVSLTSTSTGDINVDINCTCVDDVVQTTGIASTGAATTAVASTGAQTTAVASTGEATTASLLRPPVIINANNIPGNVNAAFSLRSSILAVLAFSSAVLMATL